MKSDTQANPPPVKCPASGEAGPVDVTHCEWCGAEYPVPGEDAAADAPLTTPPAAHDR